MTISANTLALLMAAGVEGDELMTIVRSIEADTAPKSRSANAERQARFRAKNKAESVTNNVTRNVTETSQVTPLACVDDKLLTTQIEPVKKTTPARDLVEFRAEFPSLDSDRLEALIKHRKAKKAQMTGHAARLFLKDVAVCGISLPEAVDTCISRNWITVKADWLAKPQARGSPPSKASSSSALANRAQELAQAMRSSNEIRPGNRSGGIPALISHLPVR